MREILGDLNAYIYAIENIVKEKRRREYFEMLDKYIMNISHDLDELENKANPEIKAYLVHPVSIVESIKEIKDKIKKAEETGFIISLSSGLLGWFPGMGVAKILCDIQNVAYNSPQGNFFLGISVGSITIGGILSGYLYYKFKERVYKNKIVKYAEKLRESLESILPKVKKKRNKQIYPFAYV